MTTNTINLRSTSTLTDYVRTCDKLATYQALIKQLERREADLRPSVLAEIGERRAITVRGQIRVLTPGEKTSIKRTCTDEEAVAFCRVHGLKYSERSAEWVAPASFTKYANEGRIDADLYQVETTQLVKIS